MNLPVKQHGNKVELNFNVARKLTARQQYVMSKLGKESKAAYMLSLFGLTKGKLWPIQHSRLGFSHNTDALATKGKNSVLKKFEKLLDNSLYSKHEPANIDVGHWVGVEIECLLPYSSFGSNESEAMEGLRKVLKDSGITRCQVKYDGSVEDSDAHGIEVTILFNTKTGWSKLDSLCEILNDYNAYVNKTCGLHVHLDVRHLKPAKAKLMGRRLNRALPVLKYLVDKSRHNNSYCNLGMSGFSRNADRYYAINMTSYFKFKTIEVRLHGGSTNFDKIKSWIEILQFVSARPMPKTGLNFQDLIDMGLPEHLIEYADKRITKLHGEAAWRVLIPAPTAPPAAAAQPTPAVQPETAA